MADTAPAQEQKDDLTERAIAAMSQSTTYLDTNYRTQLEKNIANFQNRHPAGSKYNTDAYRLRSKFFRPKTKSSVRKTEAAAATAFFANEDVVSITAENETDPVQQASAEINKALLQYRLTKTIPWFQVVVGGVQDAQVTGVVCSFQHWEYCEKRTRRKVPLQDPITKVTILDQQGKPIEDTIEDVEVIKDQPAVDLVPLENVRFHPGADWMNPIESSPYVIRLFPMFVQDVKSRMRSLDPKTGTPKWKPLTDAEILAGSDNGFDSTRQARTPKQQDPKSNLVSSAFNDYLIVWIQEHIHRIDGEDRIWYMIGQVRLSDDVPLKEIYLHGKRPLVIGTMVIETHKTIPMGPAEMGAELQAEANEIANQRADNVKFVLNKRYIARRDGRVDVKSLVRNVPGSVTLADDPEKDVKELNFPDVTSSAYAEQDRINVDFDELLGNFSQSSVQTNRSLNETVGGMSMIATGASMMTEYGLRVLVETWLEPVLRQLTSLEQHYETDVVILSLAAEKAKLYQRYGVNKITDELLQQDLTVRVNVGMGATNPQFKLQRFMLGLETFAKIAAQPPPGANMNEIGKELFGLLGYKDGARFGFGEPKDGQDPRLAQAMQIIDQMQKAIEGKQVEAAAKTKGEKEIEAMRQEGESRRTVITLEKNQETAIMVERERRKTRLLELTDENNGTRRQALIDGMTKVRESATAAEITRLETRADTAERLLKEAKETKRDEAKAQAAAQPAPAGVTVIDSSAVEPLAKVVKSIEAAIKPLGEITKAVGKAAETMAKTAEKTADKKPATKTITIKLPSGKTATGSIKEG